MFLRPQLKYRRLAYVSLHFMKHFSSFVRVWPRIQVRCTTPPHMKDLIVAITHLPKSALNQSVNLSI